VIDYEYIDRYLHQELSPEEKMAFEQRLQTDVEFAEAYQLYSSIETTMQNNTEGDATAFRESLQPLQKKYFTTESKKKGKLKRLIYIVIAAAAIFIFVFTLLPIGKPTSKTGEALYAEYAQYDKVDATIRGGSVDTIFAAAATLFNEKNYSEAIVFFEKIKAEKPEAMFYAAVCQLEIKNYTTAINNLDVLINGTTAYREKAVWYKALAYLKQNNKQQGKQQLQLIKENSPYYEKATALLKQL
jgi:tetratricopeptide (TPR) repeat protein